MQKDFFKAGKQGLQSTTSGPSNSQVPGNSFENDSSISGTREKTRGAGLTDTFSANKDSESRMSRTTPNHMKSKAAHTMRVNYNFVCDLERFEKFKTFLHDFTFNAPQCACVSSVTGQQESDPDRIRELLWQQLYSPVRWTETMQTVGAVDALEVGPGKVLQGIARRIENAPTITPAGTLDDVAAIQPN